MTEFALSRRQGHAVAVATAIASALGILAFATSASCAVAFLEKDPLTPSLGEPQAVEVFNGSRGRATVRVKVNGEARKAVSVRPAKLLLGPGQVGTFTVTMNRAVAGELVAYATDGTLARRTLAPPKPEITPDIAPPSSIEFAGTNRVPTPLSTRTRIDPRVDVPEQTFDGLAADYPSTVVGYLSSDQGNVATVTRNGDTVSVSNVDGAGEYTGKVQLSADADPTDATLRVRDSWGWALLVLIVGLFIAALSESWLSRLRPKRELATRIARLKERCTDLCSTASDEARLHRGSVGSLQRIYDDGGGKPSLLQTDGDRLSEGLNNALSDEERKNWGPAGEKLKALEQQEDTYAELLRNCVDVATLYGDLEKGLTENHFEEEALARAPLTETMNRALADRVIKTSAELEEREASAKNLRKAVVSFVDLYGRLAALEREAQRKNLSALQARALTERHRLISTYDEDESEESLKEWDKKVDELRREIVEHDTAMHPRPKELEAAMERLTSPEEDAMAEEFGPFVGPAALTSSGDSPLELLLPPRQSRYLRRKLGVADVVFALVTWPIVIGAGLALLYFKNPTFGLPGDYLAAFVWGTTGEIALTLLRRLVPTTFGGLRID